MPQPPRLCGTSPSPSWVTDVGSQGAPEEAWPLPQCCLRLTKKSKSIASGKSPLLVHGRHISGDPGPRTTLITAETADSRSNDTWAGPKALPHGLHILNVQSLGPQDSDQHQATSRTVQNDLKSNSNNSKPYVTLFSRFSHPISHLVLTGLIINSVI